MKVWLGSAVVALLACAVPVFGSDESPSLSREPEVTPKVEEAVKRACDWLAKNQDKEGGLKSSYSVAATGLAGLAWLATGSTPHEGPYAENIRRAINFLLKCQAKNGYISENGGYGPSSMYGHGYSTQFLTQAYGMVRDQELGTKLHDAVQRAVNLIEGTQNQFGGWNGSPNGALTDDGSGAVAIMQITALRAAQSCGVSTKEKVIDKSKKYLIEMTNEQGWYAYNWNSRGYGNSAATTGAGMYMIGALNLQEHPKYAKGIKNLMGSCPFLKGGGQQGQWGAAGGWGWYYYTCFYASLAIFQHGGDEWSRWYPAMSTELIKQQRKEGNWDDPYGGVFTSLAVLSLQLPYRYLPMFLEGGAGREGK
ncbi:MAG: hypothetical protein KIS92_26110 [Planctomycetota bacterium]|nr:hypothetical protein [Planctomycetota bacterium]